MKSFWIIVLIVIISCTNKVTGEQAQHCKVNSCPCCASAPDGGSNVCMSTYYCRYGCKDGYYGGKCYNICPDYCTRCAHEFGKSGHRDHKKCYLCAEGYYNGTGVRDCRTPCPENCMNNTCNKTTGHCLDGCTSNNWIGDMCDSCTIGYFGTYCLTACQVQCKDDVCDASNGECTNGCKDPRYTGSKCDQCQLGQHGENCDTTCPANCRYEVCGKNNGTCTSGCIGNFTGDKCEECNPGYYGELCEKMCMNCLLGLCDRTTGVCGYCDNGNYGQYCNLTCSSGCKNDVCNRYNSTCTFGCRNEFSGDKCCVNNNNCELCDTVTTCSMCRPGFYGNTCGQTCPGKCADSCDKLSGDCMECKNGYHGNKCTETCPYQCQTSNCSQESGKCTACNIGYYGDSCNITCPVTCHNKICYQDGGKCGDCVVGYHGVWCDIDCTTYCINETCIQETGACLYGCKEEYKDKCIQNNVVTNDNIGTILGGVGGGLCVIIIIIVLVVCLIQSRCRSQGTKENIELQPNNGDELEEQNDYEALDEELKNKKTVYSGLQSDGQYANTQI